MSHAAAAGWRNTALPLDGYERLPPLLLIHDLAESGALMGLMPAD